MYIDPQQQGIVDEWSHMPYSYQPGSTFAGGQGQQNPQQGSSGLLSAIGPALSMFAPSQSGQQQPAPQPAPTPTLQPQPYVFGDSGDSTAQENKANAAALGQGVLGASQAALAKQGGMMGQKKKFGQQGGGGDAGLGATPGSEGM